MQNVAPIPKSVPLLLPRWRPAKLSAGPPPWDFGKKPKLLAGSLPGQTLWDHPSVSLVLNVGAATLGVVGTSKLEGPWRILAWAVLIGGGVRGVTDLIRWFNMPGVSGE